MSLNITNLQAKANTVARALDDLLDEIALLNDTTPKTKTAPTTGPIYVHPYAVEQNRYANNCDGCNKQIAVGARAWVHNTKGLDGKYHCWHYDRDCIVASQSPHAAYMLDQMPPQQVINAVQATRTKLTGTPQLVAEGVGLDDDLFPSYDLTASRFEVVK
jgi:hypothetical protein